MTSSERQAVPDLNIEAFCLLYEIEVGLRELIISTLSHTRGNGWAKQSLPADVLDKYRNGKKAERESPWTQFVSHHPIYYVDFPDLAKIIEASRNWQGGFDELFQRREIVVSALRGLEPIRNKIAHNRVATSADLAIVRSVQSQIMSAVGESRFAELARRSTTAQDAPRRIMELREIAQRGLVKCLAVERLSPLEDWNSTRLQWWFDNEILGVDLAPIESYFEVLDQYAHLAHVRGSGYEIERWVRSRSVEELHRKSDTVLCQILKGDR